jgi:hypothetical protein
MTTLTQFHQDVARAQLDFAMEAVREYASEVGALKGVHPLTQDVQALTEWLDTYDAGTATLESWRAAVSGSINDCRTTRWFLYSRDHHDDLEWQVAKLRAAISMEKAGEL